MTVRFTGSFNNNLVKHCRCLSLFSCCFYWFVGCVVELYIFYILVHRIIPFFICVYFLGATLISPIVAVSLPSSRDGDTSHVMTATAASAWRRSGFLESFLTSSELSFPLCVLPFSVWAFNRINQTQLGPSAAWCFRPVGLLFVRFLTLALDQKSALLLHLLLL